MASIAPGSGPSDTRDLVLGMLVGFLFMLATMLGTLYYMGALPSVGTTAVDAPRGYIQISSDDPDPAAKPTAVWKFRSEWLTPQPK